MKETRTFGPKEITIENAIITVNGIKVGWVGEGLKMGYHPAIKLRFNNGKIFWFELDDEPLEKVFNTIRKETY